MRKSVEISLAFLCGVLALTVVCALLSTVPFDAWSASDMNSVFNPMTGTYQIPDNAIDPIGYYVFLPATFLMAAFVCVSLIRKHTV